MRKVMEAGERGKILSPEKCADKGRALRAIVNDINKLTPPPLCHCESREARGEAIS